MLADRAVVIRQRLEEAYPVTRKTRITYSGRGYSAGYAQGQRADIGNARLGPGPAHSAAPELAFLAPASRQASPEGAALPGLGSEARATRKATPKAPRGERASKQREEDRVGAVAVRPELGEPGIGGVQARDIGEDGGSVRMVTSRQRPATAVTTSRVSARCGEHVT